jgi:hypothetical protein
MSDPYSIIKLTRKEKDSKMNVLITYADGSTINPVYAPEHKDSVIRFYKELIGNRKIGRVIITMDNGEVINL